MIDRSIALFGTTELVPERILLHAGPVTATLEDGALRWVHVNGAEVLRAIAFLVRDRNWGTPSPQITNLAIRQGVDAFRVTFDALCRTKDGDLPWSAEIIGEANGTLRFNGVARPTSDFVTNRTGFVVLHPLAGVAGCPVDVTDVDGAKRRGRFPILVNPEPCWTNVRALSHEVAPGVWATCTMEGDAWETEDHRNWTDASFKTYVRPMALPYPYTIEGGTTVEQSVTLTFSNLASLPAQPTHRDDGVVVTIGGAGKTRMPAIALRAPVRWLNEAVKVTDHVRKIGPQLVSARIDPRAGHGAEEIKRIGTLAELVGAGLALELVVPCDRDPAEELEEFAMHLRRSGVRPESVMISAAENRLRLDPGPPPPPQALLGAIYLAARRALPDIPIGGGTFGHFAELNRNWPPVGLIDFIGHMTSSLVHAADDRTVMENIASLRAIRATIRAFAGDLPYRLIAGSIGADIYIEGPPTPNPENKRVTLARMDPRHRGLFGAARALAAIGEAARGGFAAIAPAAFVGELGVAYRRLDYHQPWFDDTAGAAVYPVFHVLAGLAQAAGWATVQTISSDEDRIAAIGHEAANGATMLWIANLRDVPQRVTLSGVKGRVSIACLDEKTFEAAACDPEFLRSRAAANVGDGLRIGAYGVMLIELGRRDG